MYRRNARHTSTADRRRESRLLCSDLVTLIWTDDARREHKEFAVLENVARTGASLMSGVPVPAGTELHVVSPQASFTGVVRHCEYDTNGYMVGVAFDRDSQWSGTKYLPEHLLDPRALEEGEPES